MPRGDVLRCVIDDGGEDYEATFCIDDKALSLQEFGKMMLTWNGWGIRIICVPEDELHCNPSIEMKEPNAGDEDFS